MYGYTFSRDRFEQNDTLLDLGDMIFVFKVGGVDAVRKKLSNIEPTIHTVDPLFLGITATEHSRLRYSVATDDHLYLGM